MTTLEERLQADTDNMVIFADSNNTYSVRNERTQKAYTTTEHSCNCPDHRFRHRTCKHMEYLKQSLKQDKRLELPRARREFTPEELEAYIQRW